MSDSQQPASHGRQVYPDHHDHHSGSRVMSDSQQPAGHGRQVYHDHHHHDHHGGSRVMSDSQQPAGRGRQVTAESWPPRSTAAEPLSPTKWTQTDVADASALVESLSQLMDDNKSDLNADERRRLHQILRSTKLGYIIVRSKA